MPITDKDVADLCVGIYAYPGSPPVTWDRFDDGDDSDQICWSVKVVDGCDVVVFRGSTTFEDWRRDFNAWASPFGHSKIGPVHPGFLLGLTQVLDEYRHAARGKLLVAGHSLGAEIYRMSLRVSDLDPCHADPLVSSQRDLCSFRIARLRDKVAVYPDSEFTWSPGREV